MFNKHLNHDYDMGKLRGWIRQKCLNAVGLTEDPGD